MRKIGQAFKTLAGAIKRCAFETAHSKYHHKVEKQEDGTYFVIRTAKKSI